ncbi:vWA domain-containing protein [Neptunicella sp. SCSIO 80796]|uniref:vWA domain-containing protein n=1 Tax=Neptunicella plasticusilytica TaxID=3117012 RepID=UPI003A4D5CBF
MPDMSLFHFLRPDWLWALVPMLLMLIALVLLHKQKSGWQGVLAGHLYQHIISEQVKGQSRPLWWLLALVWLLAVIALAGPTWERLPQPVYQLNTGKVVVLDMSLSMRATDIKPDRLTRAKYKAIDLVKKIAEGETGLIAYAGDAFTISPLSTDGQNLTALIPGLVPEIMPVRGSEPYLGLKAAADLLDNAGFSQGEIFWITDGVDNQQIKEISDFFGDSPYRVSILGVGTNDGAPIATSDGQLLKDSSGAIVIPKLNSSQLEALASKGRGRFAHLQPDDSDIDYLTNQALVSRDTDEKQQDDNSSGDQWREMGPWLLLLVLPLAAYGFRRGLVMAVLSVSLLSGYTPQAQANWWDDMWQRPDQQGQRAFDNQQYAQAAEQFNNPMWQGSAYYKNGDYQAALDAFSQLDSAEALYNQGNALAQLNQIDDAIEAYRQALEKQPDFEDAKQNKALLEQMKQQQEQQKQDQQDQQKQDDQSQQEKNQQNENGENSTGDGSEQQQQNDQQQNDQQQQSEQEQQSEEQEKQQQEQQSEGQSQQGQPEQSQAQAQQMEMTEEEKEQMLKMQNLLRKVPDDPAYLLKRKMQLEYQQRKRRQIHPPNKDDW